MTFLSQDLYRNLGRYITPDPQYAQTHLVGGRLFPSSHLLSYPRFKAVLRRFCKAEGIQILHDHGLWLPSNHAAASTSREMGIRLIVSPRGML